MLNEFDHAKKKIAESHAALIIFLKLDAQT